MFKTRMSPEIMRQRDEKLTALYNQVSELTNKLGTEERYYQEDLLANYVISKTANFSDSCDFDYNETGYYTSIDEATKDAKNVFELKEFYVFNLLGDLVYSSFTSETK